jgi:serine/threonine protein kinase
VWTSGGCGRRRRGGVTSRGPTARPPTSGPDRRTTIPLKPPDPPFQLGPYRVLGELGRGSFASVYRAVVQGTRGFEVLVALKVLHPHRLETETVRRFAAEARSLALLRHGNIVAVHRFVEVHHPTLGHVPVLEMEFVAGPSLQNLLTRSRYERTPLSVAATLEVSLGIARALAYAHRSEPGRRDGVVHRDLKPSNVMLASDGSARLLDFGIARLAREPSVADEPLVPAGSLAYMAPEQLASPLDVDHRADLFACGAVLFEMLTLERLIDADHPAAAAFRLERFDPGDRLGALPDRAEAFRPLLERLLQPDREARYARAEELVDALERLPPRLGRGRADLVALAGEWTGQDQVPGTERPRGSAVVEPLPEPEDRPGGRAKVLYDLLVETFRRPSDLIGFVRALPGSSMVSWEEVAVPANVSHAAQWAVDLLEGSDRVDPTLFERLAVNRPDLRLSILAAARRWGIPALDEPSGTPPGGGLGPPPGTPYDPAYYVERTQEERVALDYLRHPGKPIVIWGPPRSGKTWFASHVLRRVEMDDPAARVVFVDLDDTTRADRASLDAFLRWLSWEALRQLDQADVDLDSVWPRRGPANVRFTRFLDEHVLAGSTARTILAIDRADRIRLCDFNDDFFGLLRARAQAAGGHPWSCLRLLLVLSAGPAELTDDPNRSPVFGLSDPIGIAGFDRRSLAGLADQYGRRFTGAELDAILQRTGGNPYQLRRRLYEATIERPD